jgi:hypothetical protein
MGKSDDRAKGSSNATVVVGKRIKKKKKHTKKKQKVKAPTTQVESTTSSALPSAEELKKQEKARKKSKRQKRKTGDTAQSKAIAAGTAAAESAEATDAASESGTELVGAKRLVKAKNKDTSGANSVAVARPDAERRQVGSTYLRDWAARSNGSWRFNKLKQIWLLQHLVRPHCSQPHHELMCVALTREA